MTDRYYKGRPRKHRSLQLAQLRSLTIAAMIFVGSALAGLGLNIKWFAEEPGWGTWLRTVASGTMTLALGWYFGVALRSTLRDRGRILPYFPKPTDGTLGGAWLSGEALSDNCAALDQLAVSAGVRPLSSFGFNDDFDGEVVEWNEPDDGMRTLEAILRCLEGGSNKQPSTQSIRRELTTLRAVLQRAQETRTRFALVVRFAEGGTYQMEMDQRKGSYF